jgi:hypothetical protein
VTDGFTVPSSGSVRVASHLAISKNGTGYLIFTYMMG